ncbi:MAG TPA: SulP family inorganic anion transporter, partial [Xanthobacteraceae bacterium]
MKPSLGREIGAGVALACATLTVCLSQGLLAYAPLGHSHVALGAAAGLYGAAVAGGVAALLATSSFVVTSPRASISVIQAGLVASLLGQPAFAAHPQLILVAIALCVFFAGLWQVLFGLLNLGRIIKFTPHPVLAGFVNGVAVVIVVNQLRSYVVFHADGHGWVDVEHPGMFVFALLLTAAILAMGRWIRKIPASLSGFVVGVVVFYLARASFPTLDLGPTIGPLPGTFAAASFLSNVGDASTRAALIGMAPTLLLTSLTLALVATLEALLAFRLAQNLTDITLHPRRDLVAQGIGNCAGALAGGIAATGSPPQMLVAYQAGGRTRICGLTSAILILALDLAFPSLLAAIPLAVLTAVLLAMGIALFDRWSLRLLRDALSRGAAPGRRRAWQNLGIVAVVMTVTASISLVLGVLAGIALSCLIFIIDMSRPIVRRCYHGDELFSRRFRPAAEMEVLRAGGRRRFVLELEGVLFFGNADDLSGKTKELLANGDMVLLDMRDISDVDISGATILSNIVTSCRLRGKTVLFCNVPEQGAALRGAVDAPVFDDLDTALEWMEEEALRRAAGPRARAEALPLDRLDAVRGLLPDELAILAAHLVPREFAAGAALCREGDPADRMWILTRGSVSVRLQMAQGERDRRIASLAMGTIVGEIAFIEGGHRSATVVANEDVAALELDRAGFDTIRRDHPQVAVKLL